MKKSSPIFGSYPYIGDRENPCCYVHVEMMGVLLSYNEEAKSSHFEHLCDSESDDMSDTGIFEGLFDKISIQSQIVD